MTAGFVIERFSAAFGYGLAALASGFLVVAVLFVRGALQQKGLVKTKGFWEYFVLGFALAKAYKTLRSLVILTAVALPIGQLSNAIQSSFIHDDLGQNSTVFGIVDAAWPVGGMLAAMVLSFKMKMTDVRYMEYIVRGIVGLIAVVFAFSTSVISLVIGHAALGFSVWICRIIIDGKVLQSCATEHVGQTKTYIDVMFSFGAVVMCLSQSLISLPSTSG